MKQNRSGMIPRKFRLADGQNFVLILVLLGMMMLFTLINPNFVKSYNLLSMVQSLVPYAIIALGELFVISSGHTDLSLGALCIAAAVMAGKLYMVGFPLWTVIPLMILFGAAFGVLNGWLVAYRRVPAFIATLGTMMFVRGFSAIAVTDPNIFYPAFTWYNRLFSNAGGFPTGLLWLLGLTLIVAYVIYKSKIGRYILAIGSNPEAARLSGIRSSWYVFLAYLFGGTLAGCAGIFWSASFATVAAATGNGMEFDAIAAVFIGGTGAGGGTAAVGGSILGMTMLVVIRSGLNFALSRFNVNLNSTYVTYVMTGIIIVAAILLDLRKRQLRPRVEEHFANRKPKKAVRVVAAILIAAIFLGMFLSCVVVVVRNDRDEDSEKPLLSIISKGVSESFWVSVQNGCQKAGNEFGYRVVFRAPQGTVASYLPEALELMQTAISNDSAALGVASICEGYTNSLLRAYEAGIPVVQFDSGVFQADLDALNEAGKNPIVSTVATDSYGAAYLCGQKCFEKVRNEIVTASGEYLVGVIRYEMSETAALRVNGFIDGFAALAEADPATRGKCDFRVEEKPDPGTDNYKMALEALAERGASLIFAPNATSVEQVYNAINASGGRYDKIRFAGFDCGDNLIEWIKRDDGPVMLGAVAQNTIEMGYRTVESMIRALQGEEVEETILIPGLFYDRENIDELIEEGIVYRG